MSMTVTPGYTKAYVSVFYTNNKGDQHHMMSFQLATAANDDQPRVDVVVEKARACQADNSLMQDYIKAAIASVEANQYELTLVFGVIR